MANNNYLIYQVFSENKDHTLQIDDFKTFEEAREKYLNNEGFLLFGIYDQVSYDVIYARPFGMPYR